jgi:hypothetical protein
MPFNMLKYTLQRAFLQSSTDKHFVTRVDKFDQFDLEFYCTFSISYEFSVH